MLRTLNDLIKGESARISQFSDEICALRLLSIGILPNSQVTVVRRSPLSDALYVRVGNQYVGLRSKEAKTVLIHSS